MIWKFLAVAVAFTGALWLMGYGPDDLRRSAQSLARGNAAAVSPTGSDGSDWGRDTL